MTPFNLPAAISGEKVQYADGTALTFVTYVPEAAIEERFVFMTYDGHIITELTAKLFMEPVSTTYWVNVYQQDYDPFIGSIFDDEKTARKIGQDGIGYIKTISFTVEK